MSSTDHPLPYRELIARLKTFGIEPKPGKGSHVKLIGVVEGRRQSFVLPPHNDGWEVPKPYLAGIRRRFKISAEKLYG